MKTRAVITIVLASFAALLICAGEAQAETFRFTASADNRPYDPANEARWEWLLDEMTRLVGDEGVFHIMPGDFDDPQTTDTSLKTQFGGDVVWYPVVGNHEAETPADMTWVRGAFSSLPYVVNVGPPGSETTTYSFDYGNCHFVALNIYYDGTSDTGADGDVVDALYNWLAADLTANTKPAVFVIGHEPAYPEYAHVGDSLDEHPENRDRFWKLLNDEKVIAFFCGHTHWYYAKQVDDADWDPFTWQIDCGNAGNPREPDQTFLDVLVTDTDVTFTTWQGIQNVAYSITESWTVEIPFVAAANPSPADGATGVSPVSLSLSATVHNPRGTTDPVDVDFFGREKPSFTVIAIGDTQNYTQSGTKAIYDAQIQWIVDNAASMNIVFVTHQGDIVNTWDNTTEWANAADSMSIIDPGLLTTGFDPLIPYGVLPGNHDKEDVTNDSTYYNNTFPYDRYEGVVSWYGGHYGSTNNNNYQLFSAGGDDYVILHIEDWPDNGVYPSPGGVIEWAKSILTTYSDRKAIVTTHGYLTTSGGYAGKWGSTQYIRTNLVEAHDNVFFVLCGHHTGEHAETTTVGTRDIHELLSCYHADGWLRIMTFDPDADEVHVQTYSPWLDQYQTDGDSDFVLAFDMTSLGYSSIGSDLGVAGGSIATTPCPGLSMETQYEWYVTVEDTITHTIIPGSLWSFTTASLKASNPNPANGATAVDVDADLSWSAGIDAVSHDVYFGTDAEAVANADTASPEFKGNQAETTYDPGTLAQGVTYYWVIDEHDSVGGVTAGDIWSFTTTLPSQPNTEDFESGYTIGQKIGTHPDWYDGGGGPTVTSGIGAGGSVGLDPANNIFTWTARPFVWTEVNKVIIGMDFQTDGSAHFDDDRIGWMISNTSTDSSNIFGVQMDPGGSGYNIEGYWDGVSAADKRPSIVNLPALSANAWHRLRAEFTRLTDTSAAIDVELWSLDSAGSPVDLVASGSIADTSTLGSDAPHSKYFNATTMWPAYKNYTAAGASADNAYFEIVPLGPINQPPIAADDSSTTDEDTPITIDVLANDTDPDAGDTLAVESVTQPSNGTVANNDGTDVTYTPNENFNGVDSFTYTATDGESSSNIATVTVTVNAINDAPVAESQAVSAKENTPKAITLTGSDVDEDPLTYYVVDGPTNGALSGTEPDLTYTPNPSYTGPDSFTFKVNDATVDSEPATVAITVNANNAPVPNPDTYSIEEDGALNVDAAAGVLFNDTDADGDSLTAVLVSDVAQGNLTLNPDGSFTYSPNTNFNGSDSFTYKANDGTADSVPTTVSITITPVNDDPVAVDDPDKTTDEDTPITINVLGNDTDPDVGDSLEIHSVTQGTNGSVTIETDNTVTYSPNANFSGPDTFTYVATDGTSQSNSATVSITVTQVNDPPTANDDSTSTLRDVPVDIDVLSNDDDIEGAMLSVGSVTQPTNGSVVNNGTNVTYTPNPGYVGGDSFTYTANDGTANGNAATVSVTVSAPGPTTLFSDGFESGGLTAGGWTSSGSVAVKEPAAYEGLYGVQIGGTASITKSVSTVGFSDIHVKYARNTKGLDSGESLTVEWSANGATWNNVIESTSDTAWAQRDIALGAEANENATFSVRFRTNANKTNEYGFVDSVQITGTTAGPDLSAPVPNPMTWAAPPYATGTTSVSMTATTAADASGVEYSFVCTAGGGNNSGWQDSPTYEDTGLTAGIQYTYRVQARDKSPAQNTTDWSSEASATPIDVPPAAPTGLGATAGDGQVSLDWNNNGEADLAGYNVYRATASGGPYTQLNGTLLTTSNYLDLAVTNGVTYSYIVTAVDSATPTPNESGYSSEISATPNSQQAIYVASINMSLQPAGKNTKALAGVTVSQAQAGAIVYGNWYFNGGIVQTGANGTTDTSGYTEITSAPVKASSGDVFRFEVTNVVLAGYVYDPGQGVTENSITVP